MNSKEWDQLANYESFELIKREYAARHGRDPNTRHAREIAAPFTHARSYFRASRAAESTVKPLLLYYGVVSLSRGLTLLLSRGLREAALAPSHGLSVRDWGNELSREDPDFAALRVTVNAKGAFVELAEATGFKSLFKRNSSAINFTYPPFPAGAEFGLGEVVSRLPALRAHHQRWHDEPRCAQPEFQPASDELRIIIPKRKNPGVTRSSADALFLGTPFVFETETEKHIVYKGPNDRNALPGFTDNADAAFPNSGDLWLTAVYANGVKLSKISTLFALSYMLGMLVRYYPTQWTALIRGQIGDAALPTLAAAVELVEREFPRVVLDFLAHARPTEKTGTT